MTIMYHISHSLSTVADLHVVITLLLLYPTLKWVSSTSGPATTSYSWDLPVNTGSCTSIYTVLGQVCNFPVHRKPVLRNSNNAVFVD